MTVEESMSDDEDGSPHSVSESESESESEKDSDSVVVSSDVTRRVSVFYIFIFLVHTVCVT